MSQLGIASIGLRANLGALGTDLARARGMVLTSFQSMTGALAAAGGVIGAGLFAGRSAVNNFVAAAGAAELASFRLDAALHASGGAAGYSRTQLDNMARQLAATTGQSLTAVRAAQALTLTFHEVRGEEFNRSLALSADLAAFMGTQFDKAARLMAITLEDPISGLHRLRRAGITFTQQQIHAIEILQRANQVVGAQQILLSRVQEAVGGFATERLNTFAGRLDVIRARMVEVRETLGRALIPAVEALRPALFRFADLIRENQATLLEMGRAVGQALARLAVGVVGLMDAWGRLAPATRQSVIHFFTFAAAAGTVLVILPRLVIALAALGGGMFGMTGPVGLVAALLMNVGGGMQTVGNAATGLLNILRELVVWWSNWDSSLKSVAANLATMAAGAVVARTVLRALGIFAATTALQNWALAQAAAAAGRAAQLPAPTIAWANAQRAQQSWTNFANTVVGVSGLITVTLTAMAAGYVLVTKHINDARDAAQAFADQSMRLADEEARRQQHLTETQQRQLATGLGTHEEVVAVARAMAAGAADQQKLLEAYRQRLRSFNEVPDPTARWRRQVRFILEAGMGLKVPAGLDVALRAGEQQRRGPFAQILAQQPVRNLEEFRRSLSDAAIELDRLIDFYHRQEQQLKETEARGRSERPGQGLPAVGRAAAGAAADIIAGIPGLGQVGDRLNQMIDQEAERALAMQEVGARGSAEAHRRFQELSAQRQALKRAADEVAAIARTAPERKQQAVQRVAMQAPVEFVRSIQSSLEAASQGDIERQNAASNAATAEHTSSLVETAREILIRMARTEAAATVEPATLK